MQQRKPVTMFGYIRPYAEELRVKEYARYRAAYCGVCRSMEKNISPLLSFTLRYDFVLLALVRMLLTGDVGQTAMRRCMANPLHKKPMLEDNPSLVHTARCAALLTYYGVLDNIADERGFRRLLYRLLRIPAAAMRRTALHGGALADTDSTVCEQLAALAALEKENTPSPDAAAEPFGVLLGALFADGLADERQARIASAVGVHTGRFIYLLDAADDAQRDEVSGAYNPFVCAAREEGISAGEYLGRYRARIENALLLECAAARNAAQLADGAESHPMWPCIENIFELGMPRTAAQVLDHPGEKLPGGDIAKDGGHHTAAHHNDWR